MNRGEGVEGSDALIGMRRRGPLQGCGKTEEWEFK